MFKLYRAVIAFGVLLDFVTPVFVTPVMAEDYSATDVQILYGVNAKADAVNGTGTSNEKLTTVRFEHYGTFSLGDNYLSLDLFRGGQVGGQGAGSFGGDSKYQSFFVYMPRLSISKLTEKSLEFGPLKDVGLTTRFEYSSYANYRAVGPGLSFTWDVPGLAYLETAAYARKTNFSGTHPLIRVVWIAPFTVAGLHFSADGLLLYSRPDNLGSNILAQPELRFSLDSNKKIDLGVRVEYAAYSAGGTHYSRTTPMLMARWNF